LFTQALKPIGEVEDGEYDWLKLNNGKGWEFSGKTSLQFTQNPQVKTNPTARGANVLGPTSSPSHQPALTASRLNAAQPAPPHAAGSTSAKKRDRQYVNGNFNNAAKRSNQLPNSAIRSEHPSEPVGEAGQPGPIDAVDQGGYSQTGKVRNAEAPKKSAWQVISSTFCCG
jgi:casein kinase 1